MSNGVTDAAWLDADGRVAFSVPCAFCRYDLRTQLPDGICPECGKPVDRSVFPEMLRLAPVGWLKRLRMGLALANVTVVLCLIYMVVAADRRPTPALGQVFKPSPWPKLIVPVGMVLIGIIEVVSAAFVTAAHPAANHRNARSPVRRCTRGLIVAVSAISLAQHCAGAWIWKLSPLCSTVLSVTVNVTFGLAVVLFALHMRELARLVPQRALSKAATIFAGLFAVNTLLWAALLIASIVAFPPPSLPAAPYAVPIAATATGARTGPYLVMYADESSTLLETVPDSIPIVNLAAGAQTGAQHVAAQINHLLTPFCISLSAIGLVALVTVLVWMWRNVSRAVRERVDLASSVTG